MRAPLQVSAAPLRLQPLLPAEPGRPARLLQQHLRRESCWGNRGLRQGWRGSRDRGPPPSGSLRPQFVPCYRWGSSDRGAGHCCCLASRPERLPERKSSKWGFWLWHLQYVR